MMKALKVIRSSEWWEYKMPPLLAVGYATALMNGKSIYDSSLHIGFLLLCIIAGAIYVSIINDITDIEDDRASGKHNRLSRFTPAVRGMLLAASIIPGLICAWFLSANALALILYIASYVAFTLYSLAPFRLKNRGIAGVMADASGAHLFPSLLMVAGVSYFNDYDINWIWFAAVGVWALMYGLRGILWHQFADRENDLSIGLQTFATNKDPQSFRRHSFTIMITELIALAVMLACIGKLWPVIALMAYLLLLAVYQKKVEIIAIVPPANRQWHILMSYYYQAFFPLALLLESAVDFTSVWIVMAVHLVLFPGIILNIIIDTAYRARSYLGIIKTK